MKGILSLYKSSLPSPQIINCFCNYLPQRNLKFQLNIKWVRPEIPPLHDPKRSGDLATIPEFDKNIIKTEFQESEELKTADKQVKDIFSLKYQLAREQRIMYQNQLVEKVRRHKYDDSSPEVKIAKLTGKIRFFQPYLKARPSNTCLNRLVNNAIGKRVKELRLLREVDYKRFEWVLEKLDIEYKPFPPEYRKVTRKKSLTLLIRLKIEKEKEEKLAELKKSFDEKKVPFLMKKLEKLKWIQKVEKENNMPETVTDEDIKMCTERIEKVKIDVEARQKKGYLRSIHPYFLEPYDEELLREKEKALRENLAQLRLEEEKKLEKTKSN